MDPGSEITGAPPGGLVIRVEILDPDLYRRCGLPVFGAAFWDPDITFPHLVGVAAQVVLSPLLAGTVESLACRQQWMVAPLP